MENRKHYLAEFFGTFLLVFLGTGAIVISEEFGTFQDFGIGIAFGLAVWLLVQFFGSISDCHINPGVTLAMFVDKRIGRKKTLGYIVFQLTGALFASCLLFLLFPLNEKLGNTLPRNYWQEAFVYEFLLSFLLMLVILIATSKKALQRFAPFLIGFTVFLEAWLAGPICGASMNPARSFGPAIVSGNWSVLWLYFLAPILGMQIALVCFNTSKTLYKER